MKKKHLDQLQLNLVPEQEVCLLKDRRVLFRAKYAPFPESISDKVVHFQSLQENEDRFVISHVYEKNMADGDRTSSGMSNVLAILKRE